jgi:hypothetical protein
MTRTTTPLSGVSWDDSPLPQEVKTGDPYGDICDDIHALLTRKRSYYGCPDESPLANALAVEEEGIDPIQYQMARISEKLRRLRGLYYEGTQDQIRETIKDIAGHAVVAIACMDEIERQESE